MPESRGIYCKRNASLAEKLAFYSRPSPSGCHLWIGAKNHKGYPQMNWEGRTVHAHRKAWELANGPVPKGLMVCHHCDVRLCINVDHLFVGTGADNTQDMLSKGRHKPSMVRGDSHGMATITEAVARAILAAKGRTRATIADDFGVSKAIVDQIKTGKTWKHLTHAPNTRAE